MQAAVSVYGFLLSVYGFLLSDFLNRLTFNKKQSIIYLNKLCLAERE